VICNVARKNSLFVAEINIALMFPIWRDSCTKYRLGSRESKVSPGSQTGV